jgi:hypothetical protein
MKNSRALLVLLTTALVVACDQAGRTSSGGLPTAPAVPGNRPPVVTVKSLGDCHPKKEQYTDAIEPCTLTFEAEGSDPDGDALSYAWSGCASGQERRATCTVNAPGLYGAIVRVSDGRGAQASAAGSARGTNAPPVVRIAYVQNQPAVGRLTILLGWIDDEDIDCGYEYCRSVRASGSCSQARLDCSCRGGTDIHVTPSQPGTCRLDVEVVDPWGLAGTTTLTLDVP